mmetsp:Transcript_18836/g.38247  ORF Transcript_18836/g.38247 Transcript_18836/m.38247 type:complete len:309 (+) Transcript_18836:72-998(+)
MDEFFRFNYNDSIEEKEDFQVTDKYRKSRRLKKEILKVLEINDLTIMVVDCRDPIGSWFELFNIKRSNYTKGFLLILNKSDLVPLWVTKKWLKIFSQDFPVVAFHSNLKKPFGKKSVLSIIKQFKKSFLGKKKKISIGIIGYPNVGKSSFVNTLRGKKVSLSSSKSGETKVWKFIKLLKNIFLIDSPGLSHFPFLDSKKKILKGESNYLGGEKNLKEVSLLIRKIIDPSKKHYKKGKKNDFFRLKNENIKKRNFLSDLILREQLLKNFANGIIPWYSPIPYNKTKKNNFFSWVLGKHLPSSDGRATDS